AASEPQPVAALRAAFPNLAAQVFRHTEALIATGAGFVTATRGPRLGGLSATLPARAADAVRFQLSGGAELRVHENGASGEGAVVEGAVAYSRAGGASFWTARMDGYE